MSIAVKTDTGWQVLGGGESPGGGSDTAWGDWTIVDAPDEAETWAAPDSQGRLWKYAAFNTAGDYTINLTGGMYWVLCVGGGSKNYDGTLYVDEGQPGLVNEGYWEFGSGPQNIKVGYEDPGGGEGDITRYGHPSYVGDRISGFGVQGMGAWGNSRPGRGAYDAYNEDKGYISTITGDPLEYATGRDKNPARPGQSGSSRTSQNPQPGCVIIATVDEDKTDYYPPGALPGVGGWATITSVWDGSGVKPNRYAYPAGNPEWVAFEWTDTSTTQTLTTQAGGLVDALVCGGGGAGKDSGSVNGTSGGVITGIEHVEVTNTITVGSKGRYGTGTPAAGVSKGSMLGTLVGRAACWGHNQCGSRWDGTSNSANHWGAESEITGTLQVYGPCAATATSGPGKGGAASGDGTDGVVIVRVPAAQAAGVPASEYVDVP